MKFHNLFISALMVANSLAASAATFAADAPRSYLLLCKGGNNDVSMNSRMTTISTLPGVSDDVSGRITVSFVEVTFKRSGRPASSGLSAGECAWADRGVHADEPNKVRLWFSGISFVVKERITDGSYAKGARAESVEYEVLGSSPEARNFRSLLAALRNGGEFQAQVYNDGKGMLVMTKYGVE